MISGHIGLNGHLYKLGKAIRPTCRLCNEDDETPHHLIFDCPVTMEKMMALKGEIKDKKLSLEIYF
ncbi:Uncharacterized protein FKW44_017982 [Caligus rogercresseyi]|uniref:Reverse transcriptase zinc-binding domain-containing protein n=1 Tax=Caligus rogercresseyi TaxID=217165 RepID=A0A7T8GTV9_CALRO|nr:Uncharacterized protein FKW44_017982 [Caligus rogercresseyi]